MRTNLRTCRDTQTASGHRGRRRVDAHRAECLQVSPVAALRHIHTRRASERSSVRVATLVTSAEQNLLSGQWLFDPRFLRTALPIGAHLKPTKPGAARMAMLGGLMIESVHRYLPTWAPRYLWQSSGMPLLRRSFCVTAARMRR